MNEDNIIIKTEIIMSIFINITKFSDQEFLNFFNNTITNFLEMNFTKENSIYRDKVLFCIIKELAKNMIT